MRRGIDGLLRFVVRASDGDIGHVEHFYFDDHTWTIRYMVVDTGGWLSGRQVLISTSALKKPDWESRIFPVDLTKEQVENSPGIDTDRPVSRQHEIELSKHYHWPLYWGIGQYAGVDYPVPLYPAGAGEDKETHIEQAGDPNLRSTYQVSGYHIYATDGEIGHVHDFIVDDETWAISFIVVDTRNWWPGQKVLVSPNCIERVSWEESTVFVNLTRESIRKSPPFDDSEPLSPDYEDKLFAHYGWPRATTPKWEAEVRPPPHGADKH